MNPSSLSLIDRLSLFADGILDFLWEGSDPDGGDIQDLAERLGLIENVGFDPEKHDDHLGVCLHPGDPWYQFAGDLRSAVSRAQAAESARKDGASPQTPSLTKEGERE